MNKEQTLGEKIKTVRTNSLRPDLNLQVIYSHNQDSAYGELRDLRYADDELID